MPHSGRFTLGKETWYSLYRRLGGPKGRSGRVRNISPPPGFDPRTVQHVASRYTAPLSRYKVNYPITRLNRHLRFQEFETPRIYRESAHEAGKIVSSTQRPPLLLISLKA